MKRFETAMLRSSRRYQTADTSKSSTVWFTSLALGIVLLFFVHGLTFGQGTGQIRGQVVDSETSEPLAGVNVVLVGTQFGAATDANGNYAIINVPVGTHEVRASLVGYTGMTQTDVVVNLNQPTRVDFALEEAVVEGQEVIVTAEQNILKKEVSSTQQVVTSAQLMETPAARSLEDFLEKQVGVTSDLRIRGGSTDQTGTIVNGITFTDDRMGKPDAGIPLSAVDQVSVISGGFNAEYGNFRSGLIDISTKTGGREGYSGRVDLSMNRPQMKRFGPSLFDYKNYYLRHEFDPEVAFVGTEEGWAGSERLNRQYQTFSGWNTLADQYNDGKPADEQVTPLDLYLWDAWVHAIEPPFDELEAQGYSVPADVQQQIRDHARDPEGSFSDWNVDFGFGGPVPGIGSMLGDATFFLSHKSNKDNYVQPVSRPAVTTNTTMLTVRSDLTSTLQLTLNGIHRIERGVLDVIKSHHFPVNLGRIMPADNLNSPYMPNSGQYLYFPGVFTPKTDYTNVVGMELRHTMGSKTYWNLNISREERLSRASTPWADAGVGFSEFFETGYWERNPNPLDPNDPTPEITFGPVKLNEQPYLFSAGDQIVDGFDQNNYEQPYGSTSHRFAQIGPSWFDSTRTQQYRVRYDIARQISFHHLLKGGVELRYSILDHQMRSAWYEHLRGNFTYYWKRTPLNAGIFLQDQIEYEGMVANLGIRADYYNPGGEWPTGDIYSSEAYGTGGQHENMFDRWDRMGVLEPVDKHVAISPRLGVSFPVTERSKFFFNYGHFRSQVPWHQMFVVRQRPRVGLYDLGNPNLEPPKTVAYETGVEYNLLDQYLVRISGYYKDVTGQHGNVEYHNRAGTVSYDSWKNNNYEDIYGLELNVTKRIGRWLTGWLNYDFMFRKSGLVGRSDYYEDESKMAVFGLYEGQEGRALPRPRFNANISLHTPPSTGPNMGGFHPLDNWRLSLLPSWQAGPYFTWNPLGDLHVQDNLQWPAYHVWDMKLSKFIDVSNARFEAYLDVSNLFNQKISRLHRGEPYAGGSDRRNYLASLHLPMYDSPEYDDLRANSPDGYYEPGNDRPGDMRSDEKPYIDDPNRQLWMYTGRRQVWFGVVVQF
jgi:outer membrane receptor protein involved in Fe transport